VALARRRATGSARHPATVLAVLLMARGGAAKMASLGIAGLLALALLYYSVRNVEWRQVGQIVTGARPEGLLLAGCIATATLCVRACRWRLLLNAEGTLGFGVTFWATAAGYFGNNFLPARAGELVRTYMISARSGLDNAYVLATALSERAADAVGLVIVGAVVVLSLPDPPGWLARGARPFAILALAGGLGIACLPLLGSVGRAAIERAPLSARLRIRLIAMMDQALRGMRAFHDARRLSAFLALTAVIWCLDVVSTVVTARALGLSMTVSAACLLIASLGLGTALPSTPGYVGIYQFVAVTVLVPFGLSRTDAVAFILVAQAMNYVVIGVWGSLGILRYRRARHHV
jgi:uncharacterized membrane protein YbhN (UPF0104 family)